MTRVLKGLSAKELAIEYIKDIDRLDIEGGKRIYTDDDFRQYLTTKARRKNFAVWNECYNVYADAVHVFGMFYGELIEAVEIMRGLLRLWESYQQEEAHLNALLETMRELDCPEAVAVSGENTRELYRRSAVEALKETALNGKYTLAELKIGDDGYFFIDCSMLFKAIESDMPTFKRRYKEMKELILGVERWEKTIKTAEFRPSLIKEYIDEVKSDLALAVSSIYSRKELHRREREGMKITTTERQCAIFPYYEEIEADDEAVKMWADRFIQAYAEKKATVENSFLWS